MMYVPVRRSATNQRGDDEFEWTRCHSDVGLTFSRDRGTCIGISAFPVNVCTRDRLPCPWIRLLLRLVARVEVS